MTNDDYVAELRSHGMLSTNQAADRIEALTAKVEQLGCELNVAKYGQQDFAWSVHLAAMAELQAERAQLAHVLDNQESHYGISSNGGMWRFWADEARKVADENKILTAERDKYKKALEGIAKCTQVSPSSEDRPSYEAQIALDALGPTIHAIEAPCADLKGNVHE